MAGGEEDMDNMPELVEAVTCIDSSLLPRMNHVSVRLDNYIVMFGGTKDCLLSHKHVWQYNLDSGRWRLLLTQGGIPAGRISACGAALSGDVYMAFGKTMNGPNCRTNSMWKLSGCGFANADTLAWEEIDIGDDFEKPSPRDSLGMWAHNDELWVFGGYGSPMDGFLNEFGDWKLTDGDDEDPNCGWNNQLLKFDPENKQWMNLNPKGAIPSPRCDHAIAKLGSKVWMFGGRSAGGNLNDFYELDLPMLTWSRVDVTGIGNPITTPMHSLTPTSSDSLFLYGGYIMMHGGIRMLGVCFVFDTVTKEWHQLEHIANKIHHRILHRATAGYDGDVVVTGGLNSGMMWHDDFIIVTQPRSLLRLGIEAVHSSGELLTGAWKSLPRHLATILRDKLH